MADFVPHPLVTSVALKLAEKNVGTLEAGAAAFLSTASRQSQPEDQYLDAAKRVDDDTLDVAGKQDLADAFAEQATLPGLSLFAGFLGGSVTRDKAPWRLLYLDSRLDTWLLVQESDIIIHQRRADENAPSGVRDLVWVDATANLLRGSGPQTGDGRFLVGQLTQAGEFAASSTGGTFSARTGLLCEATTPGCCIKPRTR
jgi:hypothetical protein